jgi:hypothetical protein
VVLATDALVMSASTFVGCLTGSLPWLHFGLLCLWTLVGGLSVGLGKPRRRHREPGDHRVRRIRAFQPAGGRARGTGRAGPAGGLSQVLFLGLVRWPTPLRLQRSATAAAYRVLSRLPTASP